MISVVIPAYNAEETIERALASVLGQSHRDLEVIVVDDGSDDGTAEIVEFIAGRDRRVQLLRNAHGGPGAARNAGIDAATGEWVAFLDADDEYAPDAFASILERVGTDDVGLVIFSINTVRNYIYAWPPALATLEDRLFPGNGDRADAFMREYLAKKQMLVYSQSNKLYRRSTLTDHGIRFPEELAFGEDRLFNYAYLRHAGAVLTMSEALLDYYHGRPGTLSTSFPGNWAQTLAALAEAKMDLFRNYGYSETDLEDFRIHDFRQTISEIVRELIQRDRLGGRPLVQQSVRELSSTDLDPRLLAASAATTRRVRLVQHALKTRHPAMITAVIHALRRSEDRQILEARSREIDRDAEVARLGISDAGRREQARYWYLADYERFLDLVNPEQSRNLLRDKAILLRRLTADPTHDFLLREWIDLRRVPPHEFARFVERHERIVAKLFNGSWSNGTEIVDTSSPDLDADALYEQLISRKQYVLEGFLCQHPDLARYYEGAIASLRIHTMNLGGEVRIILAASVYFGSRDGDTSNAWTIQSFFDLASGEVTTDGLYQGWMHGASDEQFDRHPDTNTIFRGGVIPFADETRQLVLAAARLVPEVPFIGWDVACTSTGPAIIEGNAAPMFLYSWQIASRRLFGKRGMRKEFEELLVQFERHEQQRSQQAAKPMNTGGTSA